MQVQRNGDWTGDQARGRAGHDRARRSLPRHVRGAWRDSSAGKARQDGPSADAELPRAAVSDGRVVDLRRELAASREYLQSIIQELEAANEELQSANEEILSSNEELQSTNEELDTAKEELQSTNEELNTVNEELHSRNEELTRVNSDLVNLLGSVDIPIVIVGRTCHPPVHAGGRAAVQPDPGRHRPADRPDQSEFRVRRSRAAHSETIEGVAPREREVRDRQGRWHSLRVRPYKGVDNRLDGAVVAVIDIDAVKRYQRRSNTRATIS